MAYFPPFSSLFVFRTIEHKLGGSIFSFGLHAIHCKYGYYERSVGEGNGANGLGGVFTWFGFALSSVGRKTCAAGRSCEECKIK